MTLRKSTLAHAFSYIALLVFIVGTSPYSAQGVVVESDYTEGSLANRLIIIFLFLWSCMIALLHKQHVIQLFQSTWLFFTPLIIFLFASSLWSLDFNFTLRRSIVFTLTFFTIFIIVACVKDQRKLAVIILSALATKLLLDYIGVILLPSRSIHLYDVHDGAWRGTSTHKNYAGAVAGLTVVLFIISLKKRILKKRMLSLIFAIAAALFLFKTHAKAPIGFTVITLFALWSFWWLQATLKHRKGVVASYIVTILVFLPLLYYFVAFVVERYFPDQTLSGRTNLWGILLSNIVNRPFLGHGYDVFYEKTITGTMSDEQHIFFAFISHGHNGYLDTIVSIGFIGLILLLVFVILPFFLRSLDRTTEFHSNFSVFLGVWIFVLLENLFETRFLEADNGLWLLLVLSLLGVLQLGAKQTVSVGSPPVANKP